MASTYKAQILAWDWPVILRDSASGARFHLADGGHQGLAFAYEGCDADGHIGYSYLGSVMALAPSGKFYMPWTTNQTSRDVDRDSRWYQALDAVATKQDGWIESGEGDPTDLYFARYWSNEDLYES